MKKILSLLVILSLCFVVNSYALDTGDLNVKGTLNLSGVGNLAKTYNVKYYGAVGDGATDDTTVIQNAIDAANAAGGGTVYFPMPTTSYAIASSLRPKSNVRLLGEEGAIIYFTGIFAIDDNVAVTDFTVENLIFDGRSGVSKGIIMDSGSATFIYVKDCEFKNMGADGVVGIGVDFQGASDVEVTGCYFHDSSFGLRFTNSSNILADSNKLIDCGFLGNVNEAMRVWATSNPAFAGFATAVSKNVIITNNYVENASDNGIKIISQVYITDAFSGLVSDVIVSNNIVNGIDSDNSDGNDCFRIGGDNIIVDSNIAIDPGRGAFVSNGGKKITISNNQAFTTTAATTRISAAIYFGGTDAAWVVEDIKIIGNIITTDQWRNGIWCWGDTGSGTTGQGLTIANNTLIDVGSGTPAAVGAQYGIAVFRFNDVQVLGNYLDNTYEGISVSTATDSMVQNNHIVNCVDGSGRGVRTSLVTRSNVYNNHSYGNTIDYELEDANTRGMYYDATRTDQIILDDLIVEDVHPGIYIRSTSNDRSYGWHYEVGSTYNFALWRGQDDGTGFLIDAPGYPLMWFDTDNTWRLSLDTATDFIEANASSGILKLNPDVPGDVECFSDGMVDNAADGMTHRVHRRSLEGNEYVETYIDQYQIAKLTTDATQLDIASAGDVKILKGAQGSVYYFDNTDVDNAADGRSRYTYRKALEGDNLIQDYIDADQIARLYTDAAIYRITAVGQIDLNYTADGDVTCFANSASTETREFKISGYKSGDALRTLEIGVGVDAANQVSFDGLGTYDFDGAVQGNTVASDAEVLFQSTVSAVGSKTGVTTNVSTESNLTSAALAYGVIKLQAGSAKTISIANGVKGQMVTVMMTVYDGGNITLSDDDVAPGAFTKTGWDDIVFSGVGQQVTLLYVDDTVGWTIVGHYGVTISQ